MECEKIIDDAISRQSRCLNLSNRGIQVIPSNLQDARKTETLLLNDNKLMLPPTEVSSLAINLKELILDNNNFTLVPAEIILCKHLKVLSLSGNSIACLNPSIGELISLESLWLNDCLLMTLPDTLQNLVYLKKLGLRGNRLETIPTGVSSLAKLEWLNCARNSVSVLPQFHSDDLHHADFSFNGIEKFPSVFANASNLQSLILVGNLISKFEDEDLLLLCNVSKIDLRNNLIAELPSHWKGIRHVKVGRKTSAENLSVDDGP